MPTFDTPEPISATIEFDVGYARIVAGERTDTVVEVLPSDSANEADVRAARETTVTCSGGRLLVKGPRKRSLFGKPGSLDLRVELPAGSDVEAVTALGDFTCDGLLGQCRLKTSMGTIQVDEAGTARLKTDHGHIRVDHVAGDAEVSGSGRIDVGDVGGKATVKNMNGDTEIGSVRGDLRASTANGQISVGVAHAGVDAKAANGAIRIGEVVRGQVALQTAAGDLEVGIRESTAAWLDVHTDFGRLRNSLDSSDGPGTSGETVEVRAHTALGDILIHRA
ncbi:hypothetical protein Pth03_64880 [Planotetraspora thailandica]|uniref:DUF4097 domain-containing protein n=1 Tax=Planotetraspora thailandica TaxID=487172 RepID=A0A8J3XZM5_9ACTN|nr:DUF4097 family beta strand repeat-containing protein [Planotetraspora thailandica]GII58099.1 hypothetical protein Pth03_64880 [Planotetraspora thailandica]